RNQEVTATSGVVRQDRPDLRSSGDGRLSTPRDVVRGYEVAGMVTVYPIEAVGQSDPGLRPTKVAIERNLRREVDEENRIVGARRGGDTGGSPAPILLPLSVMGAEAGKRDKYDRRAQNQTEQTIQASQPASGEERGWGEDRGRGQDPRRCRDGDKA